mmetsp:Transcript_17086/g.19687  ORF Transcript_17086/g.19687 Transcript_17086/m.19687 type:complete len:541 (+) Transcript_17086:70-1692(+)
MIRSRKSPLKASDVIENTNNGTSSNKSIGNNFGKKKRSRRSNTNNEVRMSLPLFLICNLAIGLIVGSIVYYWTNSSSTTTIPGDLVSFVNVLGNKLDAKRKASFQNFRIDPRHPSHSRFFTPVPESSHKTFWYDGERRTFAIARALRSRGWRKVDKTDEAHLIYSYNNWAGWAAELQPWQRFNYIPDLEKWNEKSRFAFYYKQYETKTNSPPSVYVPESYILTQNKDEIEAFRNVLEGPRNGKNYPWVHKLSAVNQGKGITILPPNSQDLLDLPDKALEELSEHPDHHFNPKEQSIVQQYICNEMIWGNQRKFDVRMYWFVASLDPLIVLYHDGYTRVGNSAYSETTWKDTRSHLTSHTGLGAETKSSFALFEQELLEQYERKPLDQRPNFPPNTSTPIEHVRNQFKAALAEMVLIMKDESFNAPDVNKDDRLSSENGYQFYCADFIIDNDFDVWFIEPQNGCGLDEDYYFRLEMHASMFNGMFDTLEEVSTKQELGMTLLPFDKSGNWEVIYADGQMYEYDGYQRSQNKAGCKVSTEVQ